MTVFRPVELEARCSTCGRTTRAAVVSCWMCHRHIAACDDCGGAREVMRALARHQCDEEVGK